MNHLPFQYGFPVFSKKQKKKKKRARIDDNSDSDTDNELFFFLPRITGQSLSWLSLLVKSDL